MTNKANRKAIAKAICRNRIMSVIHFCISIFVIMYGLADAYVARDTTETFILSAAIFVYAMFAASRYDTRANKLIAFYKGN